MIKLGYQISHEQFSPGELLRLAGKAEMAGFSFCLSSDHFAPWNKEQGQSGFAWSWLGAALAATDIDYGVVNCPSFRYHPAIIAQASATLDQMFPGRFWLAVGSGQALNESITGEYWPPKTERNDRLKASVDIIRALWKGETVTTFDPVKTSEARLYTLPSTELKITGAAITPETAGWMANWADSLITISQPADKLKKVMTAWKENGGINKPMKIKIQVSYDTNYESALSGAYEQWRTNVFASEIQALLRSPRQFEDLALHVKPEEITDYVNISSDSGFFYDLVLQYADMGFSEIILHNVNRKQDLFIDNVAEKLLHEFGITELKH